MSTERKRKRRVTLPGHVRCSLALYVEGQRFYTQIPGRSVPRIRIKTREELDQLWRQITDVIDKSDWRTPAAPVAP